MPGVHSHYDSHASHGLMTALQVRLGDTGLLSPSVVGLGHKHNAHLCRLSTA